MRLGDILLVIASACFICGITVDAMTSGALGQWLSANLPQIGEETGRILIWLGWAALPLVIAPLVLGVWGRFAALSGTVSTIMVRVIKIIDAISITVADMVRWAALALVLVTALIVVQRYVFGISITKLQESVIYLHALLFLFSSAAALYNGGHVRVDIFYSKLGPKGRAWTDLMGVYLALIPMSWLILETSQSYVGGAWRILERSRESDGLPLVFLLKTAIPIFAVMMMAQGIAMAGRAALTLSGHDAPPIGHDDADHEL